MTEISRLWRSVDRCPACGGRAFDVIGGEATAFRSDGKAALDHPSYTVQACRTCALHYKSNVLNDAGLGAYYEALDFAPFDGDYAFPTDAALLKRLRGLPPGARVLDYGCSTGRILTDLGPAYRRFGIEINESAAQEARSRGITILPDAVVDDESTGLFDAVILTDVFEHLVTPTDTLRRLAGLLKPGGSLLMVTGLADAVRPRGRIAENWYFRIGGHLHMLSRGHINWLSDTLSLDVAAVEVMSHYMPDLKRELSEKAKATLYRIVKAGIRTPLAPLVASVPGLGRVAKWSNMPATSQSADHVLVVFSSDHRGGA